MNLIRLCPLWLATYATESPAGESSKTLRATNEAEARKRLKLRLGKIPANLRIERFNDQGMGREGTRSDSNKDA